MSAGVLCPHASGPEPRPVVGGSVAQRKVIRPKRHYMCWSQHPCPCDICVSCVWYGERARARVCMWRRNVRKGVARERGESTLLSQGSSEHSYSRGRGSQNSSLLLTGLGLGVAQVDG
jgi:hypothetical protein|eukprot:COSAG06_NODE_316_length_17668_cov_19.142410_10_plen_118_part_00